MTTLDVTRARPDYYRDSGVTLRAFHLNEAINHAMFAGRRGRVYDRIVALSGIKAGDSVLDVGSSSGYLTRRLAAAAPSVRVIGVDPSEPAIGYARRRARPGLTFVVGIAQDLWLPDESFDVVTCTLALHQIPARQRPAALAEMYRVTRPGGRVLVADLARPDVRGRNLPADLTVADEAAPDPLADPAVAAGYQLESWGKLPRLHYIVAARPRDALG